MPDLNMANPQHAAFVDALVNDDAVRSQFASDPTSVLKQYGIHYDASNPPAPSANVPSADALKTARDGIVADMAKFLGWDGGPQAYSNAAMGWEGNTKGHGGHP